MQIFPDNLGGYRGGMGHPAWDLFHVEQSVFPVVEGEDLIACFIDGVDHVAEVGRGVISVLRLHFCEIDTSFIEAGWGSGFESLNLESEPFEFVGKAA